MKLKYKTSRATNTCRLHNLDVRRAHVLDFGPAAAPPVLLLHGLGSMAQEISGALTGGLLEAGYRVIAPDRPGYGLSAPAPAGEMGPASQAAWLAAALKELQLDAILVVAHSFGAAVGLCLARLLKARLKGLVLVNPFCRPTPPAAAPLMRLAVAPVIGPWIRRVVVPVVAEPLVRWHVGKACAPEPLPPSLAALPPRLITQESALLGMAAELRAFNADLAWLSESARALDTPTRVLTGSRDQVIPARAHGDWLGQRLPNLRHSTVPTGHMLHHVRPEVVIEAARTLWSGAAAAAA